MADDLSFSVWVSQKPVSNQGFDGIQRRTRLKWVDDASVTKCFRCKSEFGWINRIHHCRKCGLAYCDACTSRRVKIPSDISIPEPSIGSNAERDPNLPVRVCDECFVQLFQLKKVGNMPKSWETYTSFIEKVTDIRDLKNISLVCREWNRIANYHLSRFFAIQYHLPGIAYKKWERDMLWHNRHHFVGHSRWMVQLIRTTPYETVVGVERVPILLNLIEQHLKCVGRHKSHHWNLMCTSRCRSGFTFEEMIVMLDETVPNEAIRSLVVYSISPMDDELMLYVGYLVHHMSTADCAINESVLGTFLLNRSMLNINIANEVYWEMMNGTEANCARSVNMYKYWLQRWAEVVPREYVQTILRGKEFADGCANISYAATTSTTTNNTKQNQTQTVPNHVTAFFRKADTVVSPTRVHLGPAKIDVESVKIFDSITRPISIPMVFETGRRESDLWKVEDIRRDHTVINFIRYVDLILKRELNTDFHIVTYDTRPTRSDAGFIAMVNDCNTLYDVATLGHMFNFVSGEVKIDDFRERFMKSCSAYCVITYLLGAGDRHLHNIMLTKDGDLFHIDYGYVMGADPKKLIFGKAPDMRIDKNIVDAFGPADQYEKFKDLVDKIYNCLRKHVEPLTALLRLLVLANPSIYIKRKFTEEKLMNELLTRFAPGESYEQARIQIINRVDNSTRATTHYAVVDALHRGTQTIPIFKGIASAWHTVKNTLF